MVVVSYDGNGDDICNAGKMVWLCTYVILMVMAVIGPAGRMALIMH